MDENGNPPPVPQPNGPNQDAADSAQNYGFRLGVNLMRPLSIGDFLSPAPTLGESSVALLPAGTGTASTAWMGLTRPTVAGAADMITGLPLIKVTDLELPFGGATFRLTRTRSNMRGTNEHGDPCGLKSSGADDWWDWTGLGWMVGENPILLIDSALPHVVGNQPRTTRLVLDAHHSIPFQLIESDGRYEAPPRFRATLTHNGTWNGTASPRHWDVLPTQYTVSLYEGALKYTFVAVWEDVPANKYYEHYYDNGLLQGDLASSSYHDRPWLPNQFRVISPPIQSSDLRYTHYPLDRSCNKGFGIPYYALCKRISDRQGHVVDIDHVPVKSRHMDDPLTEDAIECQQDGLAKGQIRSIKLKAPGANGTLVTKWTLLYVHRRVAGVRWFGWEGEPFGLAKLPGGSRYDHVTAACPNDDPGRYELHGYNVIDRIYVYENDASVADLAIDHTNLPAYDDVFTGGPGQGLSNDWRYQVRYHYDFWHEDDDLFNTNSTHAWPSTASAPWVYGRAVGAVKGPPVLMMTSIASRSSASATVTPTIRQQVYSYLGSDTGFGMAQYQPGEAFNEWMSRTPWLDAVFSSDDVARVLSAPEVPWPTSSSSPSRAEKLQYLAFRKIGSGDAVSTDFTATIKRFASLRLDPPLTSGEWPTSGGGTSDCPSPDDVKAAGQLIYGQNERFANDSAPAVVGDITSSGPNGEQRNYRIHRLVRPVEGVQPVADFAYSNYPEADSPMASQWFIPYAWQGFVPSRLMGGPNALRLAEMPDMTTRRYIVFIDEFETREAMRTVNAQYAGQYAIKPGQRSRRVVELNASGVTLRERTWQFTPQGVQVTGSGLGEEFVYKKVFDYFGMQTNETCPPMPATNQPQPQPGAYEACQADPTKMPLAAANEVLLVEHRSIGWSVGCTNDEEFDEDGDDGVGLVTFFEYEKFAAPNSPQPWQVNHPTVHLIAEGVQKGAANTHTVKLYTKQYFRNADDPATVDVSVEFTGPQTSKLQASQRPTYATNISHDTLNYRATHYLTVTESNPDPNLAPRVTQRMVVHPPRQQRPGGDWYYPIEREVYDDQGGMQWSVNGLVWNPANPMASPTSTNPDPLASLIFTYYQRDAFGRTEATIIDVDTSSTSIPASKPGAPNIQITGTNVFPLSWNRLGEGDALQYVTQFEYDDQQPSDIYFPHGLRYARRWVMHQPAVPNSSPLAPADPWCEEFIFNNIKEAVPAGQNEPARYQTQSPGERREYSGPRPEGSPRKVERGIYTETTFSIVLRGRDELAQVEEDVPDFEEFAEVRIALDPNGRPARAELREHDMGQSGNPLEPVGWKDVNELVDVRREQEIWGNITRTTRNLIGQHRRTYAGTNDNSWIGNSAERTSGIYTWTPPNGSPGTASGHNMVLLEKLDYGTGFNDVWLPTVHRRYARHPGWADDSFYEEPSSDTAAYRTVTSYDWRMRPVRVDVFDKTEATGDRLSTTLTYLDVASRPYLVVTFGRGNLTGISGALDPATRTGSEDPADPAAFYNLGTGGIKPTSIVQTIYGPDGNAKEVRTYDLNWTYSQSSSPPYQFTWHGFGPGNQEVFTRRPDGPITITKLDGAGRVKSTSSIQPGAGQGPYTFELSRTESVYDGSGNVIESRHWERAADLTGTDDTLTSSNAVRTRTCYWYDTEKRQIATVELGTEQSAGYVAGNENFTYILQGNPIPLPQANTSIVNGAWSPNAPTSFTYNNSAINGRVSLSFYDVKSGNLKYSIAPNFAVTEYVYDPNNRLKYKVENALADNLKDRRRTAHGYEFGRLTKLTAMLPFPSLPAQSSPTTNQETEVDYGADIVDESFNVVSRNNALVGVMHLPEAYTGTTAGGAAITLRYTFSGQIAERTDARAVTFRYRYDALERLKSVQVGHYSGSSFIPEYPASLSVGDDGVPVDRISFVEYAYSDRGHLETITSYPLSNAQGQPLSDPITQNKYERDLRGNLLAEYQERSREVNTNSPKIDYAWDYQPSSPFGVGQVEDVGRNRLLRMTYPGHGGLPQRNVFVGYGAQGSAEDASGRVGDLRTNLGSVTGTTSPMAAFAFFGGGRRVETSYGNNAVIGSLRADYTGVGAAGLDSFGRVKDLHYRRVAAGPFIDDDTLYRAQYTYDAAGNRKTARITQAPGETVNVWARSQLHDYNALGQLTGSKVGTLDTAGTGFVANTIRRDDQWRLDVLGNWNGNGGNESGPLPGRTTNILIDEPGTNPPDVTNRRDIADAQNRLVTRITDTGSSPTTTYLDFDAAGNLTCDGTYFYQYDAWNRLVQVNRAQVQNLPGGQTRLASDGSTQLTYIYILGPMLKHYVYDGLGRLIRTQSPYPHADFPNHGVRSEHFYYDGIRRIQELVVDPLFSLDDSESSNNPEVEGAAASAQLASPYLLDGSAAPIGYEQAQKDNLTLQVYLEREYLWGPGDKGVDELLVQFDHTQARSPWWMLQDDGGDIVAVCDTIATGSDAGKGRVVQQLTYDAYGESLSSASLQPHPVLHCGHKALFVDRLDAGVMSSSFIEYERIIPFAHTLCYNRNRTYSPQVGRFLQADPNATGVALVRATSYHGGDVPPLVDCASLDARFTDGLNIYAYLTSNTWRRFDPLGLTVIPEGASPLDAGLAPYFIGILQGIEARLMGLLVQHYSKIAAAASAAYGVASPDPGIGGLFPAGAKAAGKFGEAILDGLGGNTQVYFPTSFGKRFMDRVVAAVGYEVKTGFFTLTEEIKLQALKDKEILRLGATYANPIEAITWIFFTNPSSGRGGCDAKLKDFLEKCGIKVVEILRE